MIGEVENAILAELKAAADADALGYHWRTLETYPEDWDQYLKDKGPIAAPAAWVTFAGWPQPVDYAAELRTVGSFGLVVLAENARNETATRHGGPSRTTEPGSYQLIEDAIAVLSGKAPTDDCGAIMIGPLRFVRRLEALQQRKVSMLALELKIELVIPSAFTPPNLGDFAAFHANWDLPPFGGVDADKDTPGVQLPADAKADATDHVTLETQT